MVTYGNTEHVSDAADEAVGWELKLRYFLNSDFVRSAPYWGILFVLMSIAVYDGAGYNFAISFTDYEGLGTPDYFTLDLEMYAQALPSDAFIAAAQNNLALLVGFMTICLVLGLLLVILLDHGIRFSEKFQTVYLLPMSLSFIVAVQLWFWMFNIESSTLNLVMATPGFSPVDWLGNPSIMLGAVTLALIWQFSGYTMVVYLAGLQSIPDNQFEAAHVDGASITRTYFRIVVPQLKEASVSAATVLMVFALKAFTFLYILVGRYRPLNGMDILATLMVRHAFKFGEWAYSTATMTMLLIMALGAIGPYLYYQYKQGSF